MALIGMIIWYICWYNSGIYGITVAGMIGMIGVIAT